MKIVADENIPLIENYFSGCGDLLLKPGRLITRTDLLDADILLIRSVTQANQALLKNTRVKFVGSVTSGADHLDTDWLTANHIKWSVAEGCNTVAVVEYVVSVVAALQKAHLLKNKKVRAAVVGVGRIGERVAEFFKFLGFEVVLCDPLRSGILSTSFNELTDLDLISFHTPLTKTGKYPTYHLVQKKFLQKQKKNCILLNAGRGAVFSFEQLKRYGQELIWVLDVWENEPNIDFAVLEHTLIGTPHIAGYSLQSKYRGIDMICHAALQQDILDLPPANKVEYPVKKVSVDYAQHWQDVVLNIFNPVSVTKQTQEKLMEDPNGFDGLRKKYADRYEFEYVQLENLNLPGADRLLLKRLGFK